MKITNRAAITVTFNQPFVNWHNHLMPDMAIEANMLGESSSYLVSGNYDDPEKVIKKYYKQIFENELFQMWTDENDWPQKITHKLFCEWFSIEVSELVYDLSKRRLECLDING